MSALHLKKFDSLQAFRGLAALGVVLDHTAHSTNAFVGKIPVWLNSIFERGYLGVDFFFVLSGFIIMSSHFDDKKSIASLKIYGFKRFVRIFPPYWLVSVTLMLSYFLLPNMSGGDRGGYSLLSSLLLLPSAAPPALSVAWTLIHELMFYIIFCLFFISNRIFLIFVSVWVLAVCVTAQTVEVINFSPFLARLLNPINMEFVFGMSVAYLARKLPSHLSKLLILLGISVFILLLSWPFARECRVLFGLPFSMLVLGVVLHEYRVSLILPRWMVLMGDASYSIYLTHNPLVSLICRLVGRLHSFASWGLGMFVGVLASLFFGVLYHLFIEKPLIRLLRHRGKTKPLI